MKKAINLFIFSLIALFLISCTNMVSEKTGKISVNLPDAKAARIANGYYGEEDATGYKITVACTSDTSVKPVTQEAEGSSSVVIEDLKPGVYTVTVEALGETETVASGKAENVEVLPAVITPVKIHLIRNKATPPYTISAVFNLPYATKNSDITLDNFTITKKLADGTTEIITSNNNPQINLECELAEMEIPGKADAIITVLDEDLAEQYGNPTATVPVSVKAKPDFNIAKENELKINVSGMNLKTDFSIYTGEGEPATTEVNSVTTVLVLKKTTAPYTTKTLTRTSEINENYYSTAEFDLSTESIGAGTYDVYANVYYVNSTDYFITPVTDAAGITGTELENLGFEKHNDIIIIGSGDLPVYTCTVTPDNNILFTDEQTGALYTYSSGTLISSGSSGTYPTDTLKDCFKLTDNSGNEVTINNLSTPDGFGLDMIGESISVGASYSGTVYYPKDESGNPICITFRTKSFAPTVTVTPNSANKNATVTIQQSSTTPTVFENGTSKSATYSVYYTYKITADGGNQLSQSQEINLSEKSGNNYNTEIDLSKYSENLLITVSAYVTDKTYENLIEPVSGEKTEAYVYE